MDLAYFLWCYKDGHGLWPRHFLFDKRILVVIASFLIYLGAALRERLQYLISLIEEFLANGGRRGGVLYLVAANTALEVGEFGTNQVNMLIYKKGRLL